MPSSRDRAQTSSLGSSRDQCCRCSTEASTSDAPVTTTMMAATTSTATVRTTSTAVPMSTATATATMTSTTSVGEKGHCVLYGDPHILTFDKWSQDVRVLFQENGTYWIVRSPRISIQGHYERMDFSEHQYANGWITSLTVSGTFLEGHELTFTAGVEGEAQLSWDGVAILQGPEREILLESGLVRARRQDSPLEVWTSLDGTVPPVNAFSAAPIIRSYDVTLPFGVAMTVNSAHWLTHRSNLDVLLTMHPEPEGQSGQCGNFNGDPDDDTMEMMEDMRVEAQGAAARKLGEAAGCTKELLANATAVCTAYCGESSGFLEDCIYDVCRAGPQVAVSDCLIAWQTKVATTPAIPTAPSLVGAGCCKPRIVSMLNRQHNFTRSQCARDCASKSDCNAFAISGCSSSADGTCGGACHHYLIDSQHEADSGDCLESALNGNTFCYTIQ